MVIIDAAPFVVLNGCFFTYLLAALLCLVFFALLITLGRLVKTLLLCDVVVLQLPCNSMVVVDDTNLYPLTIPICCCCWYFLLLSALLYLVNAVMLVVVAPIKLHLFMSFFCLCRITFLS